MRQASQYLIGTHDFTSFCSAKTEVIDRVRTINEISFIRSNHELEVRFIGNGFLYNMVRILMGTLLEVGIGKRNPEEVPIILEKKNRVNAGKNSSFSRTVFVEGLLRVNCLVSISSYPQHILSIC